MDINLIILVISTVAAAACGLIVLYIIQTYRKRNVKLNVLVFFLAALMTRVVSCIFFFVLYPRLSNWFLGIGFLSSSLLGPAVLYYFRSNISVSKLRLGKWEYLHLIFPIIGFVAILFAEELAEPLYLGCALSFSIYVILVSRFKFSNAHYKKAKLREWENIFYRGIIGLGIGFLIPYFLPPYHAHALGTALVSMVIYCMFYYLLKYTPRFVEINQSFLIEPVQEKKIIRALEEGKIYLQPTITLPVFSLDIGVPQYLISKIVRKVYNKSFPDTINSLRVKEIKKKLKDPEAKNSKIETLAYDAGFNTISNFYVAFKRETNLSPKEYQNQLFEVFDKA